MNKKDIAKSILSVADKLVNKKASIDNWWQTDSAFFDAEQDEISCRIIYKNDDGFYLLKKVLGSTIDAIKVRKDNYPGNNTEFIVKWKIDGFSEKMLNVIGKNIKSPHSALGWLKSGKLKLFFDEVLELEKFIKYEIFNPVRDMKKLRTKLSNAKIISVKIKDSTYNKVQRMDEQGEFLYKIQDDLSDAIGVLEKIGQNGNISFEELNEWQEAIEKITREAKKPSEKEFMEAIESVFDWDKMMQTVIKRDAKKEEERIKYQKWLKTPAGKEKMRQEKEDNDKRRTNTRGT